MARSFFDTSALVKRYHDEPGSAKVRAILGDPGADHLISRLATVEMLSGFAGKVRAGVLADEDLLRLRGLFLADVKRRLLVPIRLLNADFRSASDLIGSHGLRRPLRTLDALQLAVALRVHRAIAIDAFVCADRKLCEVAVLEGLAVINPEAS